MDREQVAPCEQALQVAIAAACRKLWRKSSLAGIKPRDNRLDHLMAKAAVAVLEAAADVRANRSAEEA
jgi:hypothetical protein